MYNQQDKYNRSINEHIRTERHRSYHEQAYYEHRHELVWTGLGVLVALGILCFFIWNTGTWGKVLVIGIALLLSSGFIFRIVVWVIFHIQKLRQSRINSRVIETAHVTVYAHKDGRFTNFTEDVATAATTGKPKQEFTPLPYPKDTWEQSQDRKVYVAKNYDKLTWEQVKDQFELSVQQVRTAHDRHKGRINRAETPDVRSWY